MSPSFPTLDVFSLDKPPSDVIVDADVIEAVKENIQPLQKGRRATALSAIFSTPHTQRDTLLSRKRACFRLQVAQALEDTDEDGDSADALEVYSRFVAWTLESYPQGQSVESGLLELLEESTRKLKDRACYKQDPRYLELWTLYAGYVDRPSDIYSYLLANEIATDLAQLYEEYAYVLERHCRGGKVHEWLLHHSLVVTNVNTDVMSRRREADEIYNLGIARKAEPLDHLRSRYADFQRRMLSAPPAPPSSSPQSSEATTVGRRMVLGETLSQPRHPASLASDVLSAPKANAKLQIFVDPVGAVARNGDSNGWPDFGTRVSRTKENRPETHRMGDGPLRVRTPQRSVGGNAGNNGSLRNPPARRSFVPYRDEDDVVRMSPPAAPSGRTGSTSRLELPNGGELPGTPRSASMPYFDEGADGTPMSLAPCVKNNGKMSEAEALRKDPFKNYKV